MMTQRVSTLILSLALALILHGVFFSFSEAIAGNVPAIRPNVPKWGGTNQAMAKAKPGMALNVAIEAVEIVTALDGRHYWQVAARNQGSQAATDFNVYVIAHGFRRQDRKPCQPGVIHRIEAGSVGYARGDLPDFPGLHKLEVKAGGRARHYEIPAPFRRDADGKPGYALEIDRIWVRKIGNKTRWYMQTRENLYDTIPARGTGLFVRIRKRKETYCHKEKWYQNTLAASDLIKNDHPIAPGKTWTASGVIEDGAGANMPRYYDRLIVDLAGKERVLKLDKAIYYPNYNDCD